MKIRFENTVEDFIAFSQFHYAHSPTLRRQASLLSAVIPLLLAISALMTFLTLEEEFIAHPFLWYAFGIVLLVFTCIVSVFSFFLFRWLLMKSVVSSARKLYSEGTNRSLLGWQDLEILNNRLVVRRELVESSYDLRAIEKITGDDARTFVYIASNQAFVIPMNLYPEDEYREFVAELREAWENRDAPRPAAEPKLPRPQPDERIVERPF